ncbi:FtsK/SpoIIIE domain-containing protein [Nonomuraea aridisoli]|uniref:Cell division protein FtsK n=1 Tax=Nonomuraea aridisoli TaxID=2070368 RepID=A0A2W2G886_9ACTN|nr:FtsK/SpoIIIE domain-containing protein [Nonomuraea aridisoli]PZG23114.1 cell division protein FtsK [Nonomuraea aridisoli]
MRINVSVRDARSPKTPAAVVVEAEPSARVGELAAELARVVSPHGVPEAPALYVGPHPADPAATLAEAGVRDGLDLGLGVPPPVREDAEGTVELRVVSGPGAGTVYRLPPGDYDIGSAPACRVRLDGAAPPVAVRVLVRVDASVEVTPAGGALLDGETLSGAAAWPEGSQLEAGANLLELSTTTPNRAPLTPDGLSLEFNRPPRFVPDTASPHFQLPAPPDKPQRRVLPLLPILLVPALAAVVAIVVTGTWAFVFFALLSPIGALLTQSGNRKQSRVGYEEQLAEHEKRVARVRADITAAVLAEQHNRRLALPDPASLLRMAALPSERLWERRRHDPDFLTVRVGTAEVPATITVEDRAQEEYRRRASPMLKDVPVPVSVRDGGVVGLAGEPAGSLACWLVAQAAVLHSPADLRVCVLTSAAGERAWSWTRWLPHTRPQGEDTYAFVGTGAESVARRLGELGRLVAARLAAGAGPSGPSVLVVMEDARRVRTLPGVVTLLRDGPSVGVYTVCLEAEERLLPEECGAVVAPGEGGLTVRTRGAVAMTRVRPDSPRPDWYDEVARALAPLRAAGRSEEAGAALPDAVRLLDVLRVEPPAPETILARWTASGRGTRAVLGTGLDGDFTVDLVRDGPHALIAGTTGSGKSELLQTLVASLAVANRPDEMTFVLVDYKGGSAFAECADLPHTVGLVTDLDTHLVERALVSLGAELRRREQLLARAGAKDLPDYQDRRARDGSLAPLPRLLLVIDEFASMVRELPDFVSGLVNIAQRGRSLGIHLVLATQRPAGAVTADIRANTNLRIALRTTDVNESRDIIDAPDAGEISPRTPGRAFARLGPAALLPFQAGRVGGRRPAYEVSADGAAVRVVRVDWRELGGPVTQTPARAAAAGQGTATDLAVLTEAIAAAARTAGIPRQASPWLPALPDILHLSDLPPAELKSDGLPAVGYGLVDLPGEQRRAELVLDLDRTGHLHVIGSPRTGRSQVLRTLAAALARAHGVADLHLYGIDCGNGALNALNALPHCGTVVDRTEIERLGRLLDRLVAELAARQALLGGRGVADLAELRRLLPPAERPPHVVVLLDRFEVFERDYAVHDNGSYLTRLVRLMRDGAAAGIHLVLAGDRLLGSSRYAGTTEDRIVLRLNDRGDYNVIGLSARNVPEQLPPGRGIRARDLSEVQIAVLGPDLTGSGQARALAALGQELTARESGVPSGRRPMRLDVLPDVISYAEARALRGPGGLSPTRPMAGVGGDTLSVLGPDLAEVPTFVVAGPPRSGRSTALAAIASSLLEAGAGLIVLTPARSPLRRLSGASGVAAVLADAEITQAAFREALRKVPEEYGVIVVDDAELLARSDLEPDLTLLARGGAGPGWGVVAGGNAEVLSTTLGGWIAQVKRNRSGLLLSPQNFAEGELVGVRLSRGVIGQPIQPGRGHLHLGDGALRTVQVPDTRFEE